MIAAAALPVLLGNLLSACHLPPECDGSEQEAGERRLLAGREDGKMGTVRLFGGHLTVGRGGVRVTGLKKFFKRLFSL